MIYDLTSTDAHFAWTCTQFRCCMLYTASYASFVIESPDNILHSDTDVIQTQVRRQYILYSLFWGCICISTLYICIYIYCWSAEISVAMATVPLVVGRTRKETNSAPPFWNRYSRRVSWQLCCNSRLLPASRWTRLSCSTTARACSCWSARHFTSCMSVLHFLLPRPISIKFSS